MNILRFELRMLRSSTTYWIIGLVLLVAIYMSVYPAFSRDVDTLRQFYANLPAAMKGAMGLEHLSTDTEFSFLKFYGNIFPFFMLAGGIQAMTIGLGLLSREPRAKTTDFLLSKPITRTRVFLAKLTAGSLVLLFTSVIFIASSFLIAKLVGAGEFSEKTFLMESVVFLYVQFWFLAIGFLAAMLLKKVKSVASTSLAVTLGLFLAGMLGIAIGEEKVRYVTPFKSVDFLYLVDNVRYEWQYLAAGVTIIIFSLVFAYVVYVKRDVPTAA